MFWQTDKPRQLEILKQISEEKRRKDFQEQNKQDTEFKKVGVIQEADVRKLLRFWHS